MSLREYLDKRDQEKGKQVVEKSYVPWGVYSFGDLDKVHSMIEYREELQEMYYDFVCIGDNILCDFPEDAGEKLLALVKEFNARLMLMQKELVSGSVALFKSKDDGNLYWVGVPTNKFIDREDDIFTDISHRKLVKSLDDGAVNYPDLYIWHQKPAVGKATWVDYDERGFLVAGGVIHKEYEDIVVSLLANATEPLGMSQGIYQKDIKRDAEGAIIEYVPFEFTFLPHKNACNLLTTFTTQ